jgi:hypothetical protein
MVSALFVLCAPARALIEQLSDRDVARAYEVANSGDTQRARFHQAYVIAVTDPAIELIDVITELRRFVLAAEEELKAGNWMLARGGYDAKGRSLKDLLRSKMGHVAIRARLRFHPLNVYVTLPSVDVLLGEPTLLALETLRTPHVDPAPQRGDRDVISGATIEATFNAPSIANRALPVRVVVDGKEVVRVVVDFARIE